MRDYSKASARFWTGETGKWLKSQGRDFQVVGFYLFTCPMANMLGLYYLPLPTLVHEVGHIDIEGARKVLRRLSEGGYAHYDERTETVWVVEMAVHQIGERILKKDNRHKAILKALDQLRFSPYFNEFVTRYRTDFALEGVELNTKSTRGSQGASETLRSQEQEQEQKKEQKQDQDSDAPNRSEGRKSEPAGKESPTSPPGDLLEITTRCREAYPPGTYAHANWILAEREISKLTDRLGECVDPERLVAAARDYCAQQTAMGKIGTQYIRSPEKFYGGGYWRGPFPVPVDLKRDAEIVWPSVRLAISSAEGRKQFGPETRVGKVIAAMGGWHALGQRTTDQIDFAKHEFVKLFAALPAQASAA